MVWIMGPVPYLKRESKSYINDTSVYQGILTVKRPGEGVKYWIVKEAVGL